MWWHNILIYALLMNSKSKTQYKQDNVHVNMESVQCIAIAYSEVHIKEISEQLGTVDQSS